MIWHCLHCGDKTTEGPTCSSCEPYDFWLSRIAASCRAEHAVASCRAEHKPCGGCQQGGMCDGDRESMIFEGGRPTISEGMGATGGRCLTRCLGNEDLQNLRRTQGRS